MLNHHGWIAALLVAASVATAQPAHATSHEVQLGAGPTAFVSSWRGDYGVGGALRLGWRMGGVFGVDFQTAESFASIDARLLTGLSIGVRGTVPLGAVRPYARLFVIHQHEEGFVSAQNEPLGTMAGIGAGIRHRAGAGGSLGAEIPLRRDGKRASFTFFSQANATRLANDLGPDWYFGLDVGIGLDYLL
jgi:hypothetical protein